MEPVEPRMEIFFNTNASLNRMQIIANCCSTPDVDPSHSLRVSGAGYSDARQKTQLNSSPDEPLEIVPDCGRGKNESVDAVEHSPMSRKNRSGIFDAGAALERGLK